MANLPEKILAEIENVDVTLTNIQQAMDRDNKSIIELAAIGAFLNNAYNGIENILKQTLKDGNIKIAKSDSWHKDLLQLSMSNNLISEKLSDELYEYLTFRHFFIHSYGFMLEESPLNELAVNLPNVWENFLNSINEFYCNT